MNRKPHFIIFDLSGGSMSLKDSNFHQKLRVHKFDLSKFWSTTDNDTYSKIANDAEKIKLKR